MSIASVIAVTQTDTDLTFTQVLDAPRELVFHLFSEAEHIKQWWGPQGWTISVCTFDFRPGGTWHYCLRNTKGEEHWVKAHYQEIIPFERIMYTDQMVGAQGNPLEGFAPKQVIVTFDQADGKTQLNVHDQLASAADREKLVKLGFAQRFPAALNHLEQHMNNVKHMRFYPRRVS